jgi:hypothetical protein
VTPTDRERSDGSVDGESTSVLLDKRAWDRGVRWLLVSLTVVGCFYAYQRHQGLETPPGEATSPAVALPSEPIGSAARVVSLPTETPPQAAAPAETVVVPAVEEMAPTPNATPATTPSSPAGPPAHVEAPAVRDKIRADFSDGAPWPVSAGARDNRGVSWPMGVVDKQFVHGPPRGPDSVSWLERWLRSDVRAIGVRVRFAEKRSGSVAITAWRTSVLEARGPRLPRTGMRLVASPGRWQLLMIHRRGITVLSAGAYDQKGRTVSFELVRQAHRLWVVDPAGKVITVADPQVASLAGPWASWELRESKPRMNPAALLAIWAG